MQSNLRRAATAALVAGPLVLTAACGSSTPSTTADNPAKPTAGQAAAKPVSACTSVQVTPGAPDWHDEQTFAQGAGGITIQPITGMPGRCDVTMSETFISARNVGPDLDNDRWTVTLRDRTTGAVYPTTTRRTRVTLDGNPGIQIEVSATVTRDQADNLALVWQAPGVPLPDLENGNGAANEYGGAYAVPGIQELSWAAAPARPSAAPVPSPSAPSGLCPSVAFTATSAAPDWKDTATGDSGAASIAIKPNAADPTTCDVTVTEVIYSGFGAYHGPAGWAISLRDATTGATEQATTGHHAFSDTYNSGVQLTASATLPRAQADNLVLVWQAAGASAPDITKPNGGWTGAAGIYRLDGIMEQGI
jgi:hypothetical protein